MARIAIQIVISVQGNARGIVMNVGGSSLKGLRPERVSRIIAVTTTPGRTLLSIALRRSTSSASKPSLMWGTHSDGTVFGSWSE